jgi:hypothetical protein
MLVRRPAGGTTTTVDAGPAPAGADAFLATGDAAEPMGVDAATLVDAPLVHDAPPPDAPRPTPIDAAPRPPPDARVAPPIDAPARPASIDAAPRLTPDAGLPDIDYLPTGGSQR